MLELGRIRMNKNKEIKDIGKEHRRFLEAQENLIKIQNTIRPFVKLRKFKAHSTAGKWCQTSGLHK